MRVLLIIAGVAGACGSTLADYAANGPDRVNFFDEANYINTETGLAPTNDIFDSRVGIDATIIMTSGVMHSHDSGIRLGHESTSLTLYDATLRVNNIDPEKPRAIQGPGTVNVLQNSTLNVDELVKGTIVNLDSTSHLSLTDLSTNATPDLLINTNLGATRVNVVEGSTIRTYQFAPEAILSSTMLDNIFLDQTTPLSSLTAGEDFSITPVGGGSFITIPEPAAYGFIVLSGVLAMLCKRFHT